MYESIEECFMKQHVNQATHDKGNILDLVLSTDERLITEVVHEGKLGSSDHDCLNVEVVTNFSQQRKQKYYNDFKNANVEAMTQDLNLDWENELEGKDVNEAWTSFYEKLKKLQLTISR